MVQMYRVDLQPSVQFDNVIQLPLWHIITSRRDWQIFFLHSFDQKVWNTIAYLKLGLCRILSDVSEDCSEFLRPDHSVMIRIEQAEGVLEFSDLLLGQTIPCHFPEWITSNSKFKLSRKKRLELLLNLRFFVDLFHLNVIGRGERK